MAIRSQANVPHPTFSVLYLFWHLRLLAKYKEKKALNFFDKISDRLLSLNENYDGNILTVMWPI
ncbi:hypothetical protein HZS_1585 [Henneguya salminicola]|nr:hypothetical protein HZS_1585 [Henneguya salminicola]